MKVYCNGEYVTLIITDRAKDTNGANIGTISSDYKPPTSIKCPVINATNNCYLMIYNTDGGIYFYTASFTGTGNISATVTYPLTSKMPS